MKPSEVLKRITATNGTITSKDTGKTYTVEEFIKIISDKMNWSKKEIKEFESYFVDYIKVQTDASKYVESIIDKYEFIISDGVYIIRDKIVSINEVYRFFWKNEKLLPTDVENIIENVEKIEIDEWDERVDALIVNGEIKYPQAVSSSGDWI